MSPPPSSSRGLFSALHGTRIGGFISHGILVPLWTLSPLPGVAAIFMLFSGGYWPLYGAIILLLCAALMNIRFPYSPMVVRFFYEFDMTRYYNKCELRGPHLGKIAQEKTLFMFHPHGILAVGFVCNGVWNKHFNSLASVKDLDEPKNTGTVFLIARNLREWAPFFKVLCDLSGRLESATRSNIMKLMAKGRNLAIIPGGFEDATLQEKGKHRTMMSQRKGLIKYALQHGYAVTPVYTFGETDTYYTFTGMLKQRLMLNKQNIPGVLFFGEPWVPLFPRTAAECFSYVGEPLQLPKIEAPSPVEVDEWHAKYLAALAALFEAHKAEVGMKDAQLEIW